MIASGMLSWSTTSVSTSVIAAWRSAMPAR
jgi:hypothetical protein